VYVVGVWQRCCASGQNLFTRNLIGRFCPVLFVFPAQALVFCLLCIVAMVCLYVDIHGGGMRCMLLSTCYGEYGGEFKGEFKGESKGESRGEYGSECGSEYKGEYSSGEYVCDQGADDTELLRASRVSERHAPFSDKSRAVKQLDFGQCSDTDVDYVGGPKEMKINTIDEGEEGEEDLEACFRNALDERRGAHTQP
jgi:hypothetical protein